MLPPRPTNEYDDAANSRLQSLTTETSPLLQLCLLQHTRLSVEHHQSAQYLPGHDPQSDPDRLPHHALQEDEQASCAAVYSRLLCHTGIIFSL